MKKMLQWLVFPIVCTRKERDYFPSLLIDEAEINILWFLMREKPTNLYQLMKVKYELPQSLFHGIGLGHKELKKKTVTYHYPSVRHVVIKLEKKKLVRVHKDKSKPIAKVVVEPTLQGVIFYLRHSNDTGKLANVLENYSDMIPFLRNWDSLVSELKDKCARALEDTLNGFFNITETRFRIRPLKLKFEGFLESSKNLLPNPFREENESFILVRDEDAAGYLRKEEALTLRNSYIAYLIMKDIERLSFESKEEVQRLLAKLDSEKELAYFEKRQVGSNPLFKNGRLKEFLPEYSGIEYLITGMFVKNLLWKKIAEKPKETTHDYEIG